MRIGLAKSWRVMVALVVVLPGCATVAPRAESPAERYLRVRDSVEALTAMQSADEAPEIRLFVRPNYGLQPTSYVDVDFRTEDDSYAFVLAVDYDNRVRVLYPETPAAMGLVSSRQRPEMRPFFAGFGGLPQNPRYRFLRGGVIVALASARPLQLQRLADSRGGWDEGAILRLLDRSNVLQGAEELGRALTLLDQDYSYDYSTFKTPAMHAASLVSRGSIFAECGAPTSSSFYYGALPDPNDFGGFPFPAPLIRYIQIGSTLYAQYLIGSGGCGVYSAPVPVRQLPVPPQTRPDTTKRDTATVTASSMIRLRESARVADWRARDAGFAPDANGRDGARFQARALRVRPMGAPIDGAGSAPHWRPVRDD
ncbi:MAG TPA: hypothetical protein VGG84_17520, partial [Gemmatimonadaceae bacterium]